MNTTASPTASKDNPTSDKNRYSKRPWLGIAAIGLVIIVQIINIFHKNYKEDNAVITWDVQEYYMYLPALFIHHDIDLQFTDKLPAAEKQHYWTSVTATGRKAGRFTLGMAIAYLPFFLTAHAIAQLTGAAANGFSWPYQFFIMISGFSYCLMGFILLRRMLRRRFPDSAVALTILTLGLATNLYYYTAYDGAMTHATLFGFFCLFLYATDRCYSEGSLSFALLAAFALAFSTLIRPTSFIAALIFLLYDVSDSHSLKERFSFLVQHYKTLLAMLGIALLVMLPQLLYWYRQSGQLIYYSYRGERFFFDHPHILQGLFSYRKGWFVYTPVMLLIIPGFYFIFRQKRGLFYPVFFYTLIHIYIIFSWWCWWYGGSFGMRAMIETYAFLALPLTALWTVVIWSKPVKIVLLLILGGAIWLNLFQSRQAAIAVIHWDGMTKEAYWKVFGVKKKPPEELIRRPDYSAALQGRGD